MLLQEITRRVNLTDVWQAAYTAGTIIPKPFATCRYWHRSLNPKKLIDIKFSRLAVSCSLSLSLSLSLCAHAHAQHAVP
jgi:glycylpeptide N-tetradecanoyltransferase